MRPWRHPRRTLLTALPVLFALLAAGGWWHPAIVQKLDAFVYDARLRASMPSTLDDRIAIIDIDEPSLAEVGRWPWSRDRVAALVDELFVNQRVAVLGMDVVFAEPDESSGLKRLQALADGPLKNERGFQRELARLAPELDNDQRLAQALHDRPVVLGYYFTSDRNGHRSGVLPEPVITRDSLGGQGFTPHGGTATAATFPHWLQAPRRRASSTPSLTQTAWCAHCPCSRSLRATTTSHWRWACSAR